MKIIPFIQEQISQGVFINKPDYNKLDDKKIIENNFGTISTENEIMFFESKEEYEQYSMKYLPPPDSKVQEPVLLTTEEQVKLRALLAAQEANQIETK